MLPIDFSSITFPCTLIPTDFSKPIAVRLKILINPPDFGDFPMTFTELFLIFKVYLFEQCLLSLRTLVSNRRRPALRDERGSIV